MADETPNPLTAHLLALVQGRQQTEVAKLTLLTQIGASLERSTAHLEKMETILTELVERSRER